MNIYYKLIDRSFDSYYVIVYTVLRKWRRFNYLSDNLKRKIPVAWYRNPAWRSVNFARTRIPRYSGASITRVNISVTRILAAAARRRFLSTRTPYTHVEQVCMYYWREPRQSSFSFFHDISRLHLCVSVSLSRSLFTVVFGAALIYRGWEYVDTGKYSSAARSRVVGWRMRNRRGRARQRETDVRVHWEIGRSWWDYFFFPPLFRPSLFATCIDFFFLYTFAFAFGYKYIPMNCVLRVRE